MKIKVTFTNGSTIIVTVRHEAFGEFLRDFDGSPNMENWELVPV